MLIQEYIEKYQIKALVPSLVNPPTLPPGAYYKPYDKDFPVPTFAGKNEAETKCVTMYYAEDIFVLWEPSRQIKGRISEDRPDLV